MPTEIEIKLNQIQKHFQDNGVPMREINRTDRLVCTTIINGGLAFCIQLNEEKDYTGKLNLNIKLKENIIVNCHWGNSGNLNFNMKWFEEKKKIFEAEKDKKEKGIKNYCPKLKDFALNVERGGRNDDYIRLFITITMDQANWLNDLYSIFKETKFTMEYTGY